MYEVAVRRDFIATHFLIGGDWGAENRPHAHHYRLEIRFEGERLDEHGYLLDISLIERSLDAVVDYYRDSTLNDLPEFAGLNPSLEHFCRILAEEFRIRLRGAPARALTIRLWEHAQAWASYRLALDVGPPPPA